MPGEVGTVFDCILIPYTVELLGESLRTLRVAIGSSLDCYFIKLLLVRY